MAAPAWASAAQPASRPRSLPLSHCSHARPRPPPRRSHRKPLPPTSSQAPMLGPVPQARATADLSVGDLVGMGKDLVVTHVVDPLKEKAGYVVNKLEEKGHQLIDTGKALVGKAKVPLQSSPASAPCAIFSTLPGPGQARLRDRSRQGGQHHRRRQGQRPAGRGQGHAICWRPTGPQMEQRLMERPPLRSQARWSSWARWRATQGRPSATPSTPSATA